MEPEKEKRNLTPNETLRTEDEAGETDKPGEAETADRSRGSVRSDKPRGSVRSDRPRESVKSDKPRGSEIVAGARESEMIDRADRFRGSEIVDRADRFRGSEIVDRADRFRGSEIVDAADRFRGSEIVDAADRFRGSEIVDAADRFRGSEIVDAADRPGEAERAGKADRPDGTERAGRAVRPVRAQRAGKEIFYEKDEDSPLMKSKQEEIKTGETEPLDEVDGTQIPEGRKSPQYLITGAVCLGAFTAGTFLSWTSSALPILAKNNTDSPVKQPVTESQGMWIGSLLAIGAMLTAFPVGFLADKFGRKVMLIFLAFPCLFSWLIIIFTKEVEALYGARLLAGFAVGGMCVTIPLYIGEIAEKKIRGALGSFFQLLLTIGILYSYTIGAYFSYLWLGILCSIVPLIFLICTIIIPETPYYYISKRKRNLSEKSLKHVRGKKYNVDLELKKIEEEVSEAEKKKGGCKELFVRRANRKAIIIAFGLMFFQQLCGVNAVIFYTAQIFHFAGTTMAPSTCAIIVGSVQVAATAAAIFLVDVIGRKILLLLSGGVMTFCLLIFGVYFHLKNIDEELIASIGWIPLFAVNLFILVFSLGYGPLPWMMMGELFSSSIKGLASGLAVTLNWFLVFVVTKTFQDLINGLGTAGTFWFFSGITALGIIFVAVFVKETKGKTFGEINKMLNG